MDGAVQSSGDWPDSCGPTDSTMRPWGSRGVLCKVWKHTPNMFSIPPNVTTAWQRPKAAVIKKLNPQTWRDDNVKLDRHNGTNSWQRDVWLVPGGNLPSSPPSNVTDEIYRRSVTLGRPIGSGRRWKQVSTFEILFHRCMFSGTGAAASWLVSSQLQMMLKHRICSRCHLR